MGDYTIAFWIFAIVFYLVVSLITKYAGNKQKQKGAKNGKRNSTDNNGTSGTDNTDIESNK